MISTIKKLFLYKFVRFLFVGGLNTAVGYAIYATLLYLGIHYIVSNATAYIIGTIHSYFWNKFFTFKRIKKSVNEFLRFVFVCICSFVIGTLTLYLLVDFLVIWYYLDYIAIIFTCQQ